MKSYMIKNLTFDGSMIFSDNIIQKEPVFPWIITYYSENEYYVHPYLNNIIKPLKEKGHTVDIFFTTYESKKLNSYIDTLKPVKVKLNEYQVLKAGTWSNVFKIMIDSLTLVKDYQEEINSNYDYVIVSRFDNYIFENINNVYIYNIDKVDFYQKTK